MPSPYSTKKAWMKQTIRQSIIVSLKRRITPDDLLDEQWLRFKDQFQQDDELWYFKTPPETWTQCPHCGLEGYALIRDDTVVDVILLAIS